MKTRWRAMWLFLVVLSVAFATGARAMEQDPLPTLTEYDLDNAGLVITEDLTTTRTARLAVTGITAADAVTEAAKVVEIGASPVRVLGGIASQFEGGELRTVFIVVLAGGTFPFTGPPGELDSPREGRVTGIGIDAASGEFLRGFIHGG